MCLPDPDSQEMGMLVDQWLRALREEGASQLELLHRVRALADSFDNPDHQTTVLMKFEDWVFRQRGFEFDCRPHMGNVPSIRSTAVQNFMEDL